MKELNETFTVKGNVRSSKHIKGSKERYLLEQKHNLQIFGVIPFVKLQNDTWTTVKLDKTTT